ncbi:GNAT family N-acetyltransferase [Micromonospora ureilytica]|uniref:GNAT family N-acetyltransferase n=1 Tax=Micromonospora ureilytica TaxID=709868 RepID=UPI002E153164|nr:GNAT family N-acetyltransferase [Micromonospora ureilytica]
MTVEQFGSLVEAGVTMRLYAGASDIAGVQAVRAEVHRADGDLWLPGPDTSVDPSGVHPFCLIAQADSGRTVGFTWMDWWSEAADTRVYLLSGCVEPAWRRRGIGSAMLRWQEAQAIEFDGSGPVGGRSVFGANVGEHQPGNLALLTAHGYRVAFTAVDMAHDLNGLPDGDIRLPEGLTQRPIEAAHHPQIHQVIEECFAGARDGYRPRTYEEYLRDVQDIDIWCVVWAGDDIAAVVVNELQADGTARTPWVAVGTAWRRRGVGLAVMRRTLRILAEAGVSTARLSTVAENPNNSVRLYEKAGYRVTAWQPRYRKPVEAPDQVPWS